MVQVLDVTRHTGSRNGQFEAHHGLGRVRHAMGRHDEALHHQETALQIAVGLDQPADQARAHDGLAHSYLAGQPGRWRAGDRSGWQDTAGHL
ncbi:MAG TPA: tetratricopeptide repeat protein [Pseudonocardiaceae bacterium]|nr:tetratricopeptide repeat protein [Pseudonocardiaceae bacterium]